MQFRMKLPRSVEAGIRERKVGELDEITIEVREGGLTTLPE